MSNKVYEVSTKKGVMTDAGLITGDIVLEDAGDQVIAKYAGSDDAMIVDASHYKDFNGGNISGDMEGFIALLKEPSSGPRPAQ